MALAPGSLLAGRADANRRRRAGLLGAVAAVLAVLAVAAGRLAGGGAVAAAVLVAVAAGATAAAWRWSDAVVLAGSRARPADPVAHARLHNLVEGLCASAGLPKPRLFVVDAPALNAFATGRHPRRAALVATTGLLDGLTRLELEAVVAHELAHVRQRDTAVSTLAAATIGLALGPVPPLRERALGRALPPDRERWADLAAVALTRYPPGLVAALEKLRRGPTVVAGTPAAFAHLWIQTPVARPGGTHPPLQERIEALLEL